ncbi:hypothetical protein KUTeg_001559 [Tegillarca granosa]|uniref:ATP-dependent DNA helicase n=1 Tax=Tegillarca granosa TaxID=220873 RepID=A0ABQ9FRS5_TEGGR|nr:hypothetical protein KUTeg_001559 [Tegillarca granosa]
MELFDNFGLTIETMEDKATAQNGDHEKRNRFIRVFIDIVIFSTAFLIVILTSVDKIMIIEPYKRGFSCDDHELKYPLIEETVNGPLIIVLAIFVLPVIMLFVETFYLLVLDEDDRRLFNYISRLYKTIGWYLLGGTFTLLVVEICKACVGRLRPHFFEVCKPNWNYINCSEYYVTDYNCTNEDEEEVISLRPSMENKLILDQAIKGHSVIILGQSGTGKSTLSKQIAKEIIAKGKNVACTATTGIASLNIGGRTIHSWCGIGDGRYSNSELIQTQIDFIKAVNDVSKGDLPEDTLNLIKRLNRPLPPGDDPIRLCARNFDCFVFNSCKLMDMDGKVHVFKAVDDGDLTKLENIPAPKSLHLKIGCPVMLLKNLSSKLVNGLRDTVSYINNENETVGVNFISLNSENFSADNVNFDDCLGCCKYNIDEVKQQGVAESHYTFPNHELSDFSEDELNEIDFLLSSDADLMAIGETGNETEKNIEAEVEKVIDKVEKFVNNLFASLTDILKKKHVSLFENAPSELDYEVCSVIFDKVKSIVLSKQFQHLMVSKENKSKTVSMLISESGLGKLRYIFGRCIAKSRYSHMEIAKQNLYNTKNRESVATSFLKVKMLDFLTTSYSDLENNSNFTGTLHETQRKQNLTEGLTNITDSTFLYAKELEEKRNCIQSVHNFHVYGSDFLKYCHSVLLDNSVLFNKWRNLFSKFEISDKYLFTSVKNAENCLQELYADVIFRFCRIADNQFRKDILHQVGKKNRSDSAKGSTVNLLLNLN